MVNIHTNTLQHRNMLRNILQHLASPVACIMQRGGPMTITRRCNESLKLPCPCTFCLCIHASLSPEMNGLGYTVRDRRRWRNRGSAVSRSAADCETRVKSADGPNKRVPESFYNGLEEPVENRSEGASCERRPAFKVWRTTAVTLCSPSTPYGVTNTIILGGHVKSGRRGTSSVIYMNTHCDQSEKYASTSSTLNRSFLRDFC